MSGLISTLGVYTVLRIGVEVMARQSGLLERTTDRNTLTSIVVMNAWVWGMFGYFMATP